MLSMMAKPNENQVSAMVSEGLYRTDLEDLPVVELIKCFNDWRSGRHVRPNHKSGTVSYCPQIQECRELIESRRAVALGASRRYREAAKEAEKSAALRDRLANRTPDELARVKIVQDMLAGSKIADGRFVMGPLRPHPLNSWTYEQIEDESVIINGRGVPYTMRPNRDYGYLTAREAEALHSGQSPP